MGPNPNGPLSKLLELLDSQVEGSVQWVLLEISWIFVAETNLLVLPYSNFIVVNNWNCPSPKFANIMEMCVCFFNCGPFDDPLKGIAFASIDNMSPFIIATSPCHRCQGCVAVGVPWCRDSWCFTSLSMAGFRR